MNNLTNIIHRWDDIVKLSKGEMIWPSFCDFHTSNFCNQYCEGCAYDGMLGNQIMPKSDHFRIVDELLSVGVRAFDFAGGGEPSVIPYLPELMRHIHEKNGYCGMITNGLIMGGSLIESLIYGATYVRFSLEASCEHDYSKYKRVAGQHWKKVLNNIVALRHAKEQIGSTLEISVKFAVGKSLRGVEHYNRCIELGRRLGAERITIKALRHEPEELSIAERHEEDYILRNVIEREQADGLVSYWIAPLEEFQISQCWLNPVHTVIDWDGSVYICCYFYYGRKDELKIGNLMGRSFKEIWEDKYHRFQINGIDKRNCLRVDCKFFHHHQAVHAGLIRGHMEFL